MNVLPTGAICIVDSAAGVYIPQEFAYDWGDLVVGDDLDEDLAVLRAGPDSEEYWEAWMRVCTNARIKWQGRLWYLWPDTDLWLVPDDE